jgi:DNA replication ATP-dependent helicase Dna2
MGSKMKMITKKIHHIRALIIGRNALAQYIKSGNQLPPMLTHRKFTCQRCYALDACLFYHKAFEDGTGNTVNQSGLKIEFEEKTKDLTDVHIQFFKKWDSLISLEEGDDEGIRREIWAFESEEREKLGR